MGHVCSCGSDADAGQRRKHSSGGYSAADALNDASRSGMRSSSYESESPQSMLALQPGGAASHPQQHAESAPSIPSDHAPLQGELPQDQEEELPAPQPDADAASLSPLEGSCSGQLATQQPYNVADKSFSTDSLPRYRNSDEPESPRSTISTPRGGSAQRERSGNSASSGASAELLGCIDADFTTEDDVTFHSSNSSSMTAAANGGPVAGDLSSIEEYHTPMVPAAGQQPPTAQESQVQLVGAPSGSSPSLGDAAGCSFGLSRASSLTPTPRQEAANPMHTIVDEQEQVEARARIIIPRINIASGVTNVLNQMHGGQQPERQDAGRSVADFDHSARGSSTGSWVAGSSLSGGTGAGNRSGGVASRAISFNNSGGAASEYGVPVTVTAPFALPPPMLLTAAAIEAVGASSSSDPLASASRTMMWVSTDAIGGDDPPPDRNSQDDSQQPPQQQQTQPLARHDSSPREMCM